MNEKQSKNLVNSCIDKAELIEALKDMVNQHCSCSSDGCETVHLDSMALSANAHAMRLLARHGELEITDQYGRRVIGNWKEQKNETD